MIDYNVKDSSSKLRLGGKVVRTKLINKAAPLKCGFTYIQDDTVYYMNNTLRSNGVIEYYIPENTTIVLAAAIDRVIPLGIKVITGTVSNKFEYTTPYPSNILTFTVIGDSDGNFTARIINEEDI